MKQKLMENWQLLILISPISIVCVFMQAFYGRKPQGLNGALQEVGITFEGREHSGTVSIPVHCHSALFFHNYNLLGLSEKIMFSSHINLRIHTKKIQ